MTTETTGYTKKSRGRLRVFDREAAFGRAMTPFWQHGYETVSLADFMEVTDARVPALYMEFTNREELFRTVLDRYITHFAAKHEARLFCEGKNLESALEDYFAAITTRFTSKDTPAGCFMTNASATLAIPSRDIAHTVRSRHAMQEQTLTQFLRQHQQRGETPAHCDM